MLGHEAVVIMNPKGSPLAHRLNFFIPVKGLLGRYRGEVEHLVIPFADVMRFILPLAQSWLYTLYFVNCPPVSVDNTANTSPK